MTPRLLLVLSENWTMTSPRDLRALVAVIWPGQSSDRPAGAAESLANSIDAVALASASTSTTRNAQRQQPVAGPWPGCAAAVWWPIGQPSWDLRP